MTTRFSLRARRFLTVSASGLLVAQPAWLSAQPSSSPVTDPQAVLRDAVERELNGLHALEGTAATPGASPIRHAAYANQPPGHGGAVAAGTRFEDPVVRQTAGFRETSTSTIVLAQAQQPAPPANSEVLQELEKLYRQDGQQMPAFDPSQLPNTVQGPKTVGQTPQVHVRPAQPGETAKGGMAGFFRKLNPFARSRPRTAAPPATRPQARPLARQLPAQPARPAARSVDAPPRELPVDVRNAAVGRPASSPAAQSPSRPTPRPLAAPHAAPAAAAAAAVAIRPADDLADPFTEVSETEADREADPFSGIKLSEAPPPPAEEPSRPAIALHEAPAQSAADPRLKRITERTGTGFKGFCPVALRDRRQLVDAGSECFTVFEGRTYHFASVEAQAKFESNPGPYLPVSGGKDPVLLQQGGGEVEGSLDHAVWFHDRLHMFSSVETLAAFVETIELDAE
ncbi:MAG: hypothetical protein WD069_04930 [Planctomycetales bacterium]